jgi:hypothetical protein
MEDFLTFKEWVINQQEYKDLFTKYEGSPISIFLGGSRTNQILVNDQSDYDLICILDKNYKFLDNVVFKNKYNGSTVHVYCWSYQSLFNILLNEDSLRHTRLYQFFIYAFTEFNIYETDRGQVLKDFVNTNKKYLMEYGLYKLIDAGHNYFDQIKQSANKDALGKPLAHILSCYKNLITDSITNSYSIEFIKNIKNKKNISNEDWELIKKVCTRLENFYQNFNVSKFNSLRLCLLGWVDYGIC